MIDDDLIDDCYLDFEEKFDIITQDHNYALRNWSNSSVEQYSSSAVVNVSNQSTFIYTISIMSTINNYINSFNIFTAKRNSAKHAREKHIRRIGHPTCVNY